MNGTRGAEVSVCATNNTNGGFRIHPRQTEETWTELQITMVDAAILRTNKSMFSSFYRFSLLYVAMSLYSEASRPTKDQLNSGGFMCIPVLRFVWVSHDLNIVDGMSNNKKPEIGRPAPSTMIALEKILQRASPEISCSSSSTKICKG